MGNNLFGIDIAGLVKTHIAPGLLPGVLGVRTEGDRDPDNLTAGKAITYVPKTCRGFWGDVAPALIDGVNIMVGDKKGLVIGDTLQDGVVPKKGDHLTFEAMTLTVVRILSRDPAAATYQLLCRDVKDDGSA